MTKQLERRRAGEAETGVIVLGMYFCENLLFIEYLPVLFSGSGSVCSREERLGPKLSSRVDRQRRTCKKNSTSHFCSLRGHFHQIMAKISPILSP